MLQRQLIKYMKVYFTADNQAEQDLQERFSRIVDIMNSVGVLVMSNLAQKNISGFSSQDLEKIGQTGEMLLERMDALIIEGSRPIPESGYLIAIALAHKKPILYLLEEGKKANKNLLHLQNDKNTVKFLKLKNYTEESLEKVLIDFLRVAERGEGKESPTIKFTLRVTPRIERYLRWKTSNSKLSKADYLREMIDDIIDSDDDYQKFIRHYDK